MKTIQQVAWALRVLWQQKEIKPSDRLRLWRKSINLFIAFLAFTDRNRPRYQLKGVMISAVGSALYDYETDWCPRDFEHSLFRKFLDLYVANETAKQMAEMIFRADRIGNWKDDGLMRGSIALCFYHYVIRSRCMCYPPEELYIYGRKLQILDDLLDLKEDEANGHTNCFLTPRADEYRRELVEFLESDFFKMLEGNSLVYCKLRAVCLKRLGKEEMKRPTVRELIRTSRPNNGVFAFLLTLAGFKLAGWTSYGLLVALAFAGLTLSIMVFNDVVDRGRDAKKNKLTATLFPLSVLGFWILVSGVSLGVIVLVAVKSPAVALFCFGVWALGLAYSAMRHLYPLNNLTVAFCAGSPVICGALWNGNFRIETFLVFGTIFGTILITERLKDIEDMEDDRGYKMTAATRRGHIGAMLPTTALTLPYLPLLCLALYPVWPVKLTALCFLPLVFCLGVGSTRRSFLKYGDRIAELFLALLLLALICA